MRATEENAHHREQQIPCLAFCILGAFLLLLPFGLILPGTPGGLKADESAYYMMAMSLAFDGDVRLAAEDTDRLFEEFSGRRTRNVVISSNDGWQTVYYGKPHLYSLLSAPFARVAGYRGMLVFNMLLFLGMIWMLARYLSHLHGASIAMFFSVLFFLMGTTWNYAFWIQPEILTMFGVGGALYFGLRRSVRLATGEPTGTATLTALPMAALSGALLAVAVYNKPYLAPLGLVFLLGAIHQGRAVGRSQALRWFGVWCGGVAFAFLLAGASAYVLTGSVSSYVGVARDSVTVCEPGVMPLIPELEARRATTEQSTSAHSDLSADALNGDDLSGDPREINPIDAAPPATAAKSGNTKSWAWIFRIPPVPLREHAENLVYFLIGRHTGLLIYFPFVGAAIAAFLWASWRRRTAPVRDPLQVERWALLVTTLGIGVFLLVFISWNWQGGGGFVGNRYFVTAVPAFGYLAVRLRPALLLLPALAAGLFLGPSLISPLGLIAPEPTLQAHTRSAPLSALPLELSLKNVPGYYAERMGGMRLLARKDRWLRRGESFWTQGNGTTDVTVLVDAQLGATSFLVTGVTERPADVDLRFAGARGSARVAQGESKIVTLAPQRHRKRHNPNYQLWTVYPLEITSDAGATLAWQRHMPPNSCPDFAQNDVYHESFFAGAQVSILGPAERLAEDVYSARWEAVDAPKVVAPGDAFKATVAITNTSSADWPTSGGTAQVALSYHWLDAETLEVVEFNGARSAFAAPVPAGVTTELEMTIRAPSQAGEYVLELDPVFEHVAWFKDRGVAPYQVEIRVERPAV